MPIINSVKEAEAVVTTIKPNRKLNFCKNGHILNRFGTCDVKGCK